MMFLGETLTFLPCVCPHVDFKVDILYERLSSLAALIWFLSCECPHLDFKIGILRELCHTGCIDMVCIPCVSSDVT